MNLSLLVLRHGKSDWGAQYGGDPDRPLKKRGMRSAKSMGRLLSETGFAPQVVLSSSAVRARRTAELAHEAGGWTCPVEFHQDLYGASAESIVELLRRLEAGPERVMVVGHEPTCSNLVGLLTGGSPPFFPTAALARIDFEAGAWQRVGPGMGQLVWLLPPRLLEEP